MLLFIELDVISVEFFVNPLRFLFFFRLLGKQEFTSNLGGHITQYYVDIECFFARSHLNLVDGELLCHVLV